MRLPFSRRERARQAAIQADAAWPEYVRARHATRQPAMERWAYVINIALEAAVGDLPEPPDEVGSSDGLANKKDP